MVLGKMCIYEKNMGKGVQRFVAWPPEGVDVRWDDSILFLKSRPEVGNHSGHFHCY